MNSRAERRAELTAAARSRGLDGVLVFSWRRSAVAWLTGYAPGFVTNHATLWCDTSGEAALGVRFPYEIERAADSSGLPVRACEQPSGMVPPAARRVGLIGGDLAIDETPPALVDDLSRRGVEVVDLRAWMDEAQECKLPEEIAGLTKAAEIGAQALLVCGDSAPQGWTDWEIASAVEARCRVLGARRAGCLVGIGPGSVVTECSGRTVGPGDSVGLELTLYADEWCMHVNHQLPPSVPNAADVAADRACRDARDAMLGAMAAGVPVDVVVAVGDDVLDSFGFLAHKEYDFGHGLSADTPAHPRMISGTGRELVDQSVVALHVAVRVPDGSTGFVGGPVLVTTTGAQELVEGAPWTSSSN